MTKTLEKGSRVRLLDRPGDVRGVVRTISTEPNRPRRPVQVQLNPGRADSTFWFAADELEVLA